MPENKWGKEVKKAIIDYGITMGELAEKVGYSREYVSSIVSGRIRCNDVVRQKISDVLGINAAMTD